jgi:hypothetical protein
MAGAGKTAGRKIDGLKVRMLNGEKVIAVLYNGKATGNGKYFTGEVNGKLVCDKNGKPIPLTEIGELV